MTLVEKLNLLWKFLFLAVFTYGVVSLTCCKQRCSTSGCSYKAGTQVQKQCGVNCTKPCCAEKKGI